MTSYDDELQEFHSLTEAEELRRINSDLQAQLRRAKAKSEALVEAAFRGARDAMISLGPVPLVRTPRADRREHHKPEVALWVLTDWQLSKVTTTYNTQVAKRRVLSFCDHAKVVTDIQRRDHPVEECVILFGGDIGEGLFNFPHQVFEIDATIFDQYVTGARLVVDVVRRALADHRKVTVISEWGNHGRIGSKRATVPPSDNFDRMVYELARWRFEGEKRLTWEDTDEDIRHVEIGNYRALLVHGDEVGRNGFVSRSQFVQHCNRWKAGGHSWRFQDVYVGHYHVHGEDALADGEGAVFWTGSPESDNRYAQTGMASNAKPTQRLHFIEPRKGLVTGQYKVRLG